MQAPSPESVAIDVTLKSGPRTVNKLRQICPALVTLHAIAENLVCTSLNQSTPTIFVNIAAYRDRDCRNSIHDLFAKARWPDRVFIGLCWQFLSPNDDDWQPIPERAEQCRITAVPVAESEGVCWARHQVQKLWRGEDYVLQIDSHMRFVEHWDEKCLTMLAACPSERPVLSNYPAAFTPPDQIDSHVVSVIHASGFDQDGLLKQGSVGLVPDKLGEVPQAAFFCAGGFLFGPSGWITEVPYDPYLYFIGEEITLAVRLFTHGWDIFGPTDVLAYHDYNDHPDRPRHWNDRKDWTALNERSVRRVRHLLAMEPSSDPEVLRDIDRYGLGMVRSLAGYQALTTIDFKARTIGGLTTAELDHQATPEQKRERCRSVFSRIWKQNSWGADETRSGSGSTIAATAVLRPQLAELWRFLGVRRLLDAGCGDLNWMAEISGELDFYLGVDVVPEVIQDLERRFANRANHFFALRDIALDDLPRTDVIFCRDVLTHLPTLEIKAVLERFKASGSFYLIATSFDRQPNKDIALGEWRPVDLAAEPFQLPPPYIRILEQSGEGKALGVWRLDQL